MPDICFVSFSPASCTSCSKLALPAAILDTAFGNLRSNGCCIACGSLVIVSSVFSPARWEILTTRSPAQYRHFSKGGDPGPGPVRPSAERAEELSLTTSIR